MAFGIDSQSRRLHVSDARVFGWDNSQIGNKDRRKDRMPRIYRPMKRGNDGLPLTGTQSKELGVRVPPNERADIDVADHGIVTLNRRGMSVAADWRLLQPHLIPKRLNDVCYGASGPNSLSIYRHGEGDFEEGPVNETLSLALKDGSSRHANVVPVSETQIDEFLSQLAATRPHWIDEEPQ